VGNLVLHKLRPMAVSLYHADCRDALRRLPDNCIDSVVTDPPYAIESIQKRFGGKNSAPAQHGTDGAYARAARGFMGKEWDTGEVAFDVAFWAEVLRVLKPGGALLAFGFTRTYHRLATAIEDAGAEIRDQFAWMYGTGMPHNHRIDVEGFEGWCTPSLKGAWEPVAVARKPISERTISANVARWGTGGYNIEACRVGDESTKRVGRERGIMKFAGQNVRPSHGAVDEVSTGSEKGRYPTNVYHDGSAEIIELFPHSRGQLARTRGDRGSKTSNTYGTMADGLPMEPRGDEGVGSALLLFPQGFETRSCWIRPSDRQAHRSDGLLLSSRHSTRWNGPRSVRWIRYYASCSA
jgi:site-specific DNA-methyltransferase (adenine-specific)